MHHRANGKVRSKLGKGNEYVAGFWMVGDGVCLVAEVGD